MGGWCNHRIKAVSKTVVVVAVVLVLAIAGIAALSITNLIPSSTTTAAQTTSMKIVALVWEDYTVPEVLDPLKQKYPNLIVENSIFTSQPEMFAKLRGGFEADIVTPCVDFLPRLIDSGLVQPIDPSKLSNWNKLFKEIREFPSIWRDGKLYLLPETYGIEAGVTYRKDKVSGIEKWSDIFSPQYRNRVIILNDPRLGIVMGAWALGYDDPWKLTSEDLQRIKDFYRNNKDKILKFYSSDLEARELMASGDAWILAGSGPAQAAWLRSENVEAEFVLPEGKGIGWVCGFSLLKTLKDVNAAYIYMDYFISEEPQRYYALEWLYGPVNEVTFRSLPEEWKEETGITGPGALPNVFPLTDPPNLEEWLKTWEEIIAG
ncbi:MAG: extracellular solute-binding protein [Candidatus Caldarchaeum sp.]|nr:extracellular solute-binding protein [Candidatus Caldarchaeum sp.]